MKYIFFTVLSIYFGMASAQSFPDKQAIPNIIAPINLNEDTTTVHLSDLFASSVQIDSISFSRGLSYNWNKKDGTVVIKVSITQVRPLAEMKLWNKGVPYSVLLKTARRGPAVSAPRIGTSKLGPSSFTISLKYENPGFSFVVYWQNFRLGHDYIKTVGDEMLISIPYEANNIDRSYIRIFCSDTFNAGNDILLPLQNGKVIRDPSQLTQADTQSYISRYIPVQKFDELGNSLDLGMYNPAFQILNPNDITFKDVSSALVRSMEAYGSHYSMGHICAFADLPYFISQMTSVIPPPPDDSAQNRLAMYIAFSIAIPGIPVIYYGDTTYVSKKITSDSLTSSQKKFKETVDKLFALRSSHMALMYGETEVYAKGDIMIIWRNYFSERIVFVFNRSRQAQTVETGTEIGGYVPKFGHMGKGTKVDLPPLSFELFVGRRM